MSGSSSRVGRIQLFGLAGLALSAYACYVEHKRRGDRGYKAFCDVNESMSCSKVFTSNWGHFFSAVGLFPAGHFLDMPNATYGVLFFTVVLLHPYLPLGDYRSKARAVFLLTLPVVGIAGYLAYVLAFVLHDFCLVCVATYVCNFGILWNSYKASAVTPGTRSKPKAR